MAHPFAQKFSRLATQSCLFCNKPTTDMVRHVSVHNEDPQLTFNLLGIVVIAKQVHSKGYQCPFLKCSFTGLPAALYAHLTGHITLTGQEHQQTHPISHSPSISTETSTPACSTPTLSANSTGLVTPISQAFSEPPNKKRRIEPPSSPSPATATTRPDTIPTERAEKLEKISDYIEDNLGCCPFHSISSSLEIVNQHSELRHCDLIDTTLYKTVFRKTMRKIVNSNILCFSCCGCKNFHHPVERSCDSEALQDIWIGIPYLIFCVPAIQRIVFGVLGKHNYHQVVHDIESFVLWLFQASPRNSVPTRATPNAFDLLIAFSSCSQEFSNIEWADALAEANERIADL
ncbi:uncharacterized protein EDB91DRAFT_1088298 [Suillus paluster]|uniref:uncharacterized protein n=1 Tax=Suillus paluster TaxID=48578 RepID=UPI001B876CB3|nr:uncharacterized protein EDB91DRAFT_1088298 [Suillus paluster]KAG1721946.1 hypothetical protein EDB91DRAFT_1088298 [Suillus paluster]